jgi:hypothetical protein
MSASTSATPLDATPSALKALYVVNKRAKQLARDATERPPTPGVVSPDCPEALDRRKRALYELKRRVLAQMHGDASRIELHEIRGSEYYCFYFGSWSFHTPTDEFDVSVTVDGHLSLPDFDTSHATTRVRMPLDDALRALHEEFDIDVNDCLDRRHLVAPTGEFVDIGWSSVATC